MRNRGPILTLLAVVALAFVLLAVNMASGGGGQDTEASSPAVADAPAQAAPPAPDAPPAAAPSAFPPQATYTGKTTGRKVGEATVAVAVKDGKASAYVCDGKKLESWLEGSADGASVKLTGKNGSELTASLASGKLSGTVAADGGSWQFTATPSKSPAGLYRARNSNVDAGWIVQPDGTQTGVQNVRGQQSPAPALNPAAGSAVVGGSAIPVSTIQGGDASTVGR